jgi:hypothetical protein
MGNSDRIACPDDPRTMREQNVCVFALSKTLGGKTDDARAEERRCDEPECTTLLTTQALRMEVGPHICDSPLAKALDGEIVIEELVHVYGPNGTGRGFHSAAFVWHGQGTEVKGELSGVSNAGLHRQPPFQPCQRCRAAGFEEGRFCGTVVDTDQSELKGAQVFGAYLLQLRRPSATGGVPAGKAIGSLEGVIVRPCT